MSTTQAVRAELRIQLKSETEFEPSEISRDIQAFVDELAPALSSTVYVTKNGQGIEIVARYLLHHLESQTLSIEGIITELIFKRLSPAESFALKYHRTVHD